MPRRPTPEPRWYTLEYAAELLAISRSQMFDLVNEGVIPAVIPPGFKRGRRIKAEDLDAYIRSATPAERPIDDGRPTRSRSRKSAA